MATTIVSIIDENGFSHVPRYYWTPWTYPYEETRPSTKWGGFRPGCSRRGWRCLTKMQLPFAPPVLTDIAICGRYIRPCSRRQLSIVADSCPARRFDLLGSPRLHL